MIKIAFYDPTGTQRPTDQSAAIRTFYENLADMGGIKISKMAFDAYLKTWNISNKIGLPGLNDTTQDQVFYIAFGQAWCTKQLTRYRQLQLDQDSHAPERFRVLGSLRQSRDFANTFQCKVNSRMNPEPDERCKIWGGG